MTKFPYQAAIRRGWNKAVAPSSSITDPISRHRAQFLNLMLVSFMFVAPFILVIQILISPTVNLATDTSPKAVTMGLAIVFIVYIINHTPYYRIANYIAISVGLVAVVVSAMASSPPHIEILYLVALPLAGILLLSATENSIVCLLTIVCLVVFIKLMSDISNDIFKDMITFTIIVEAMILFASYQRNKLEVDRQRQVIENEKVRILSRFINDISHELRTPLSIIGTGVYLLDKSSDPEARHQRVDLIQNQIEYITVLVEDMLTMTRLDSRLLPVSNRLAIGDLVRETTTRLTEKATAKGLTVELNVQPELPPIQGDMKECQLAFTHLLKNAILYTPQGGIKVRAFMRQTSIVIEIEDTGIGISESDRSRIFERFYRVEQARTTRGTGLGLAVTKKIIEDHHGSIEVESVLGQGSLFRVILKP